MAADEPGSEHPLDGRPPRAVVSKFAASELPQAEFDKLVDWSKARDVASRLPDDVEGLGTRRKP